MDPWYLVPDIETVGNVLGPGCSSAMGLFMEHGPCRILDADGPKYHNESWNSNANIIYIDQPIGAGFSYAEYGENVVRLCVIACSS